MRGRDERRGVICICFLGNQSSKKLIHWLRDIGVGFGVTLAPSYDFVFL